MSSKQNSDRDNTVAVFNRAISNFEGSDGQQFIPTATFKGAKAGYYFSKGSQGTGYYLDSNHGTKAPHSTINEASGDEPGPSRPKQLRLATAEELLKEAEDAAGEPQMQIVDAKGLKKLVTTLERKFNHNVEQRAKHVDEPQRFLESEIELDEAVKAMTAVTTSPELYPDLVSAGVVPTLLSVLHHENGDIAADAIELLSELTDADAVEDSQEEARVLVDALLEGGLLEALVQRLAALNELVPEEATAVYNALTVVENCVELRSEVAAQAAARPGLMEWLLTRLRPKSEVDANKQYAAEVLALILQAGGEPARRRFVDLGGVDRALQAVAPYRTREPSTLEEEEFVENVSNALCAVLMEPAAKAAFVESEGVELMVLIMKGRTAARTAALKCLDFATTRCRDACDRAVDQGALRTVFGLLMGKLKAKGVKRRDEAAAAEEEERSLSVVGNLMSGVSTATRRERVAAKFVENEFEKCDRLMELFFRYYTRVASAETQLAEEAADEGVDAEELLLAQLDAGLYTLQQCAIVAGEVWAVGDVGARRRLLALLHQRGRSLAELRGVLVEHRGQLAAEDGDVEGGVGERKKRVDHVTGLLTALGHKEEDKKEAEGEKEVGEKEDAIGKREREGEAINGEEGAEEGREKRQKVT